MRIRTTMGGCGIVVGVLLSAQIVRAQDQASAEQGMQVYAAQKCSVCHSIEGKGAKKGPLDEVGSRLTQDEVRQWIVNAPEMTKKTKATRKPLMKNYAHLPKSEVDALVAFVSSLKKR